VFSSLQLKRSFQLAPIVVSLGVLVLPATAATGEVPNLFQDAKSTAGQLQRDVVEMESYARSGLTWKSHADQINRVAEHINKAGQIAA
jgi:hypothetical protein